MANKTDENDGDVTAFIESVPNETRRAEALVMLELLGRVSGLPAKMWGASIIGFGRYHYKYASGREGDFMRIGFSPRKANMAVYIIPGFENYPEILSRIGKFKTGKSCFYINKLADIDLAVLEELAAASLKDMAKNYPEEST